MAVLGTAGWVWAAAARAHRPVSLVALVVYCALVGLVGLIVMTKIEMHLEPWRFMS